MISKLSAKYQFCAIHTADNTDGNVTGGGKNFTAGRNLPLDRARRQALAQGHVIYQEELDSKQISNSTC